VRIPDHVYDHNCDDECNYCGELRVPFSHVYDNAADESCNVCGKVRELNYIQEGFAWYDEEELVFEPTRSGSYRFEFGVKEYPFDPYVSVFDVYGNKIPYNNDAYQGPTNGYYDLEFTLTLTAGERYILIIRAYDRFWIEVDYLCDHAYDNVCDTTCNLCGELRETSHRYVAATCTAPKTCSKCGATEGEALGHNYNAVVTAPTCTAAGYTTYTCACGDTYVGNTVAAPGHNWVDATCTAPKTCTVCGATEGEALGHDYNAVVTVPTCTAAGYTTYTCACGDTYVGDTVAAPGHNWVDATCTAPKTCSKCGATEGEALGHDWIPATCLRQETCGTCGETRGELAEHTYDNACDTTCNVEECGYIREVADHIWSEGTCSVCGAASPSKVTITKEPTTGYAQMGNKVSVKLTAEGEGLRYEWWIKNNGSKKYSKSSVTKATYSTTMSDKAKDRLVFCRVYDQYGNMVQCKTVRLREAVSLTKQPSSQVVYAQSGKKASIKITASGDELKYTWYIKNEGASKYAKSSVTSATYSATMSSKSKGRRVYCVVTDKYGKTVQTKTFILRESVSITTQPKTVTVAKNKTAKVTVKASGDGLKYTWYIKNEGASKYAKSSVTSASYSTTMNAKSKNRLVYCVVTDKYGNTVKTVTVRLKMK